MTLQALAATGPRPAAAPRRKVTYQIAARVYDPAVPSKMLVGPYFPHADLNITGRVRFDVPYPLPLDPAADLPPQLLGSASVVAAGPGRARERNFQGALRIQVSRQSGTQAAHVESTEKAGVGEHRHVRESASAAHALHGVPLRGDGP